jgi:hypothetical protein
LSAIWRAIANAQDVEVLSVTLDAEKAGTFFGVMKAALPCFVAAPNFLSVGWDLFWSLGLRQVAHSVLYSIS